MPDLKKFPGPLPNPGSGEAAALGCDCPVHANYAGTEEPEGGWVLKDTCRVHGTPTPKRGIPPESADAAEPEEQPRHPMEQEVVTPTPTEATVRVSLATPRADAEVNALEHVVEAMQELTRPQQRRLAAYVINRYGTGDD